MDILRLGISGVLLLHMGTLIFVCVLHLIQSHHPNKTTVLKDPFGETRIHLQPDQIIISNHILIVVKLSTTPMLNIRHHTLYKHTIDKKENKPNQIE